VKSFARFTLVGLTGFATDAGVLLALADGLGWDPIAARLVSATLATLVTWALNRGWTFKGASTGPALSEFLRYAAVVGAAAAVNIAVYAGVLALVPGLRAMLIIPLAFGAAAGFAFNYWGASRFAFTGSRSPA
jgi:putative flippase GtrA